ncbi:hypothetical protein [Rhodococcus opacus]|uniref:hypothetical protein n=1 Tax=Rhodococcus opacus TaxID=37919 RepID=UPI001F544770|nr:hypothetical protein [Rhodococcus opacus]
MKSRATKRAIIVSPKLLAKPCKLTRSDGAVPPGVATVIRAVGVRDVASGLVLTAAPSGAALRAAVVVWVVSDFGDAVVMDRVWLLTVDH